jgi:riboflavin kinase / FMN adenylyltransferase
MQTCHGIAQFVPPPAGTTLTIGNFDGVHRGHALIIDTSRTVASRLGTPVVVMTFEPHPLQVLRPEHAPPRLVTLQEKLHLLEARGVDACIVVRSELALLSMSAQTFLAEICDRCRPRAFVEGPDFNFGRGRGGSVDTLRAYADRLGYAVHLVETAGCPDLPETPAIRSSAIRAALREGRVDVARAMLGRPYRIVGTVGSGAGRGAALGFPTANLEDIPHLLPQEAVYSAVGQREDGSLYPAAVNIGPQPTFADATPRVEAHLVGVSEPLRGRRIGVHFLARLRGQERFLSVDSLKAQLEHDVATTIRHVQTLASAGGPPILPL